jgi:hypothetical protein
VKPLHERVRSVLRELALLPEGSAIDYGRDVVSQGTGGHGKHGTASTPPPAIHSLAVEYAERFERLVIAAERDLHQARTGAPLLDRDRNGRRRVNRRAITGPAYEGRDAVFVAFAESVSVTAVERARASAGLEPSTGFKRDRPLTNAKGD